MLLNRCPSRETLSELIAKPDSPGIAKHVASCAICREVLAELCDNEELLRELRLATDEPMDDRTRRRIVARCRRILRENRPAGREPGHDHG